jgi:hypothetical protein
MRILDDWNFLNKPVKISHQISHYDIFLSKSLENLIERSAEGLKTVESEFLSQKT